MPDHTIEATHSHIRAVVKHTRSPRALAATDRERGAAMVEYALLLVLVLIVAFVSILLFGDTVVALFDFAAGTFNSSPATP